MGRAIRYVPYPVVGGFLGATGCLILLGAIRVIRPSPPVRKPRSIRKPADLV
jgi:SulP family sulfate permease